MTNFVLLHFQELESLFQCINRKLPYHTEINQLIWLTNKLSG